MAHSGDLLLDDDAAHRAVHRGHRAGAAARRSTACSSAATATSARSCPAARAQYIPAPGLLTPWGQPPRVRDVKTPNDILTTTTVPEAGANLVTLSTGRGGSATEPNTAVNEPATNTVIDTPVENAVEPVIETVTNETETAVETPEPVTTEPVTTEPAGHRHRPTTETAETTKPAKPAKKDPAAAIRQGLKDFGDNVPYRQEADRWRGVLAPGIAVGQRQERIDQVGVRRLEG